MASSYMLKYIVLKGSEGGGLLSLETQQQKVKIVLDAELKNRSEKSYLITLFAPKGEKTSFQINSLKETIYATSTQFMNDVTKYVAAVITSIGKEGILMKGQCAAFEWGIVLPAMQLTMKEERVQTRTKSVKVSDPKTLSKSESMAADVLTSKDADDSTKKVEKDSEDCDHQAEQDHNEWELLTKEEESIRVIDLTSEEQACDQPEQDDLIFESAKISEELIAEPVEDKKKQKIFNLEETSACAPKLVQKEHAQEPFAVFQKKWPNSKWEIVYYPGSQERYYITGEIYDDDHELKAHCYAVPGYPTGGGMKNEAYLEDGGKGYWLLFMHPQTGEYLEVF
jgi:hypothetical protein